VGGASGIPASLVKNWWVWFVVRVPGAISVAVFWPRAYAGRETSDATLYRHWATLFTHGLLPYRDFRVEYPPGVVPLMLLPPWRDVAEFRIELVAVALVVDAVTMRSILRAGNHRLGSWVWALAPAALGPIEWARLDIFVAAAVIAAVLALEQDHLRRAGWWLAFAALVKLWPMALVAVVAFTLTDRRLRQFLAAAAFTLAAFVAPVLVWGGWPGLRWMLSDQVGRGVQVESLVAIPLFMARQLGLRERVIFSHGSHEIVGAGASGMATASTWTLLVGVLGVLLLAWRRRNHSNAVVLVTLAMVAIVIATAKVLSPQYMLWAVAAVTVSIDSIYRPRRLFGWIVVGLVVTQADYPLLYFKLIEANTDSTFIAAAHGAGILGFALAALTAAGRDLRVRRPG
jgi:hypothetical protein